MNTATDAIQINTILAATIDTETDSTPPPQSQPVDLKITPVSPAATHRDRKIYPLNQPVVLQPGPYC